MSPPLVECLVAHGRAGFVGRFRCAPGTPVPARGAAVVVRTARGLELGEVLCEAAPDFAALVADAVAGNVERGSITFRLVRRLVDEIVLVGEEPIAAAMRWAAGELHQRIEGSAALGIAALQQGRLGSLTDRRVGVVLTGGNVDPGTFERVLGGSSMDR